MRYAPGIALSIALLVVGGASQAQTHDIPLGEPSATAVVRAGTLSRSDADSPTDTAGSPVVATVANRSGESIATMSSTANASAPPTGFTIAQGTPTAPAERTAVPDDSITIQPRTTRTAVQIDNAVAVTLSVFPNTVIEGGGVVDFVVTATVPSEVATGSTVAVTLAVDASSTAVVTTDETTDYTVSGSLPTITIGEGETNARGVVRLTVPPGDANEPEETIVIGGSSAGNTVSTATITIATTQLAAGETRLTQKVMVIREQSNGEFSTTDVPNGLGYDVNGFISSTSSFRFESENLRMYALTTSHSASRVTAWLTTGKVAAREKAKDEWVVRLRGDVTADLPLVTSNNLGGFIFGNASPSPRRYEWDSNDATLPTFTDGDTFSATLITRALVSPAFASGASMSDQTWHRGTPVETSVPAVERGTTPITYSLVPALPTGFGVDIYHPGDAIPSDVTCTVTLPALCGTPTTEFLPDDDVQLRATTVHNRSTNLTFALEVTTGPPTELTIIPRQLAFQLDWEPPEIDNSNVTITGYRVEYRNISGGDTTHGTAIESTTDTTYTDNRWQTQNVNSEIGYQVVAISNAGESMPAAEVSAVVVASAVPDAIDDLSATANTTGTIAITLNWIAPGDQGATITGYKVRRTAAENPSATDWTEFTQSGTGTTYSDTDSALVAGETYYYEVRATNSQGDAIAWSNRAPATAPAAPAFRSGESIAKMTWHPMTAAAVSLPAVESGSGTITYSIEPALPTNLGLTLYQPGATIPNTEVAACASATLPALCGTPSREFPTNAAMRWIATGVGDATDEVTFTFEVTTSPPTNVTLTPRRLGFRVDWDPPAIVNSNVTISGYRIEYRNISEESAYFTVAENTGSTATTYLDQTRWVSGDGGTNAGYRVYAISNAGTSSASEETEERVVEQANPDPVADLSATAATPATPTVMLTWTAPSDEGADITGYTVRRTTVETSPTPGDYVEITTGSASPGYTDTDSALTGGTTYYYQVRATNSVGDADWSNTAEVLVPALPAFRSGQTIARQTVFRDDEDIADVLPRVASGTPPITYSIDPPLPADLGVALYQEGDTIPDDEDHARCANATLPALCGTPTREFPTNESMRWIATGVQGITAELTFTFEITTRPPSGLTLTGTDGLDFQLDWMAPEIDNSNVTVRSYNIEYFWRAADGQGSGTFIDLVPDTNSTSTTYTHTWPASAAGTFVAYQVRAISNAGTSENSNVQTATVPEQPPPKITDLMAAAAGPQAVNLEWTAPDDDDISGYTVRRTTMADPSPSDWTAIATNTGNTDVSYSDTDTALVGGTTYYYQVAAINMVGTAEWSDSVMVTTPVPAAFASGATIAKQTLHRDFNQEVPMPAVESGTAPITYSLDPALPMELGLTIYQPGDTIPENVRCTVPLPAICGTPVREFITNDAMRWVATGVGSTADLTFSFEVTTQPPSSFRVTQHPTDFTIALNWTPPTIANSNVTVSNYKIQSSSSGVGDTVWRDLLDVASTTLTYTDTRWSSADLGTTVNYRVAAISNAGTSGWARFPGVTLSNLAPPDAIVDLRATATGPQTVNLSWSTPSDNGIALTSYRVQRTTVAINPQPRDWISVTGNIEAAATSYTDTSASLQANTRYFYQAAAVNGNDRAEWSNTAPVTTTAPVAPDAVAAPRLTAGYTEITIDWSEPAQDGGADIVGYLVHYRAEEAGPPWTVLRDSPSDMYTVAAGTTEYTHTMLNDGDTVYYWVEARNRVGSSTFDVASVAHATTLERSTIAFATDSVALTVDEGQTSGPITLELSTELASGIRLRVPLTVTGIGTVALASDFAAFTQAAGIDAPSGNYRATVTGSGLTWTVSAESDMNWDPGEGVRFALDTTHANWPTQLIAGANRTATVRINDAEELPLITLSLSTVGLAEIGGILTSTLSVAADYSGNRGFFQSPHTLVLDFSRSTATLGASGVGDFESSGTQFTLPAGNLQPTQTITLTGFADAVANEPVETIIVDGTVQNSAGTVVIGTSDVVEATGSIAEGLTASIDFDVAEVNEPADDVGYTVRLSATPTSVFGLTVNVATNRSASPARDHGNLDLITVSFPANTNTLTQTGTVDIIGDNLAEQDEDMQLFLSGDTVPTDATVDTSPTTLVIRDTDIVEVSIARGANEPAEVQEGNSVNFSISISTATEVQVNVPWSIALSGPLEAGDFTDHTGTVRFRAGSPAGSARIFAIAAVADADDEEGVEPFTVVLGTPVSILGDRVTVLPGRGRASASLVEPDETRPTVTEIEMPARVTGMFTATIRFSENVTGFAAETDVTVNNATVGAATPTPADQRQVFTFPVTPNASVLDGETLTVAVAADSLEDDSSNGVEAFSATTVLDLNAPTPTLTTDPPAPLNRDFELTIDFGEVVRNFAVGDINISPSATIQESTFAPTTDAQTYTVMVTAPTSSETIVIAIPRRAAQDLVNRDSRVASIDVNVDHTPPTPIVSNQPTSPVTEDFTIRLSFVEPINDLAIDDFDTGNVTVTGVTQVAGMNSYTVGLRPLADGDVTLGLRAGAITDAAGNPNVADPDMFTTRAQLTDLTATIRPIASPAPENFTIVVEFGGKVTGFDAATDITVSSNATAAAPVSVTAPDADVNRVFNVAITALDEAEITVSIGAGVTTAAAANDDRTNAASNEATATADLTFPTVTFSAAPPTHTSADFTFQITFGESIGETFRIDGGDISLSHTGTGTAAASVTEVTAGTVYDISITLPADDGTLTVGVPANAVQDAVGLTNAAVTREVIVDRARPMVEFVSPPTPSGSTPLNAGFTVRIRVDEDVTGMAVDDFSLNGVPNDAVSIDESTFMAAAGDREFTVDLTVPNMEGTADDLDGDVVIIVAEGAVMDATGNTNPTAMHTVAVDTIWSSPRLDPPHGTRVSGDFTLSVDFGEAVTGFVEGDIAPDRGSGVAMGTAAADPAAGPGVYTVGITVPDAEGQFTIGVRGSAAADLAGNNSRGAAAVYTLDTTVPTAQANAASNTPDPVTGEFDVEVDFSELMRRVKAAEFIVGNGRITDITGPTGGDVYTVTIEPTANGNVTLDLKAGPDGGAADIAGNGIAATTGLFSRPAIVTPLTVQASGDRHVGPSFQVQLAFRMAIDPTSLTATDLTAQNATVVSVEESTDPDEAGQGRFFVVELTADAAGLVSVSLPAMSVTEVDTGVANRASNTFTAIADLTPPVVTLALTPDTTTHVNANFDLQITFDEDVGSSFTRRDIRLNPSDARVGTFMANTAGRDYTATITLPAEDGTVTVTIPAGTVRNAAKLGNAQQTRTVTVDREVPTITFPDAPDAASSDFVLTVRFSGGPVSSFDSTMVTASGAGATVGSAITVTEGVEYTVPIGLPTADGRMTITIAADATMDTTGNGNPVKTHNVTVDRVNPMIATIDDGITGNITGPFVLTITFSEKVLGLADSEVMIANGNGSALTETSTGNNPSVFTMPVTPVANGPLTVDIGGMVAQDAAGNNNDAATQFTATVALDRPSVSISTTGGHEFDGVTYFNTATFDVTVTFSEAVTGMDSATDDFVIGNGTISNVQGSGTTYTGTVTPSGDDVVVTIGVPADAATASTGANTGNGNSASFFHNYGADQVAPAVQAIDVSSGLVNGPFTVTVRFTEPVTDFVLNELVITNGTADTLVGVEPTAEYTTTVTPTAHGEVTLNVAAGTVMDRATNSMSVAATERAVTVDMNPPTVSGIARANPVPAIVKAEFDVVVNFSEAVAEFTAADLIVTNSTVGAPTPAADRMSYTVPIEPLADGEVTVQVRANSITDDAGNRGPAAASPGTPFAQMADVPEPPGAPGEVAAVAGREAIVLRWQYPADDGGGRVTSYRIETSLTGLAGTWRDLVTSTGNGLTTYRQAFSNTELTRHYRVYGINVAGEGDVSDAASATTITGIRDRNLLDANGDGQMTLTDCECYFNISHFRSLLEARSGSAGFRRTFLSACLPPGVEPTEQAINAQYSQLLTNWAALQSDPWVDVNGSGAVGTDDLLILAYVEQFPELIGDGSADSGFAHYRRAFIGPLVANGAPRTDEEIRRLIRLARGT